MHVTTAAIYTRLSLAVTNETSRERQEADARAYASSRGWEVSAVYTDLLSAYKDVKRPGFDQFVGALRTGAVDVGIVWKLDRLTRKGITDIAPILEALKAGGSALASVNDNIDTTTAMGKGVLGLLASVAEAESETISLRVRSAQAHAAEHGKPSGGGYRPFGYNDDRVTVVAEEADLIVEAARRVLEGESFYAVCADWQRRDVRTPTGRHWQERQLRQMLAAPRLGGMRVYRGEIVGKASWPAILDEITAARIQAVSAYSGDRGRSPRVYLLTGLIVCGRCGSPLRPQRRHPAKTRSYNCVAMPGFPNCGRLRVQAEPVEELIAVQVLARVSAGRFTTTVASAVDVDDAAVIEAGEAQLLALAAEWGGSGQLSRDEWRAAKAPIDARLATARRRQAGRARAGIVSPYLREPALLAERWPGMTLADRREVVDAAIATVRVAPATRMGRPFDTSRVTIDWR